MSVCPLAALAVVGAGLIALFRWIERDLDRALDQAFNRNRDQ